MKNKVFILLFAFMAFLGIWIFYQYQKAMDYFYKFRGLRFDKIALRRTTGTLILEIENKSAFSASLLSCSLIMNINTVFVCDLTIDDKITIEPHSSFILPLNFDFEPHKILSIKNIFALEGILYPDKVMIAFAGTITIKKGLFTVTIPIAINKPYSWYI